MVMKKTYFKYLFRSIEQDLSRLLAIFLIVLLGIGFLVGLMSTSPDLYTTADKYYDDTNFTDIYLQSTIGFDKKDKDFIKENLDDVYLIEDSYQIDEFAYLNEEENRILSRVMTKDFSSNNSIDELTLVNGEFPTNLNECVVLETYPSMIKVNINDYVYIPDPNNEDNYIEYQVSGIVKDPNYLSKQDITTTIGNGNIDAVIYIDKDSLKDAPITMIKMTFNDTKKMDSFSDSYDDYINKKVEDLQGFRENLIDNRVNGLIDSTVTSSFNSIFNQSFNSMSEIESFINNLEDSIAKYIYQSAYSLIKNTISNQINEQLNPSEAVIYVLSRKQIQSNVIFDTDANKVNAVAVVFPIFFFIIALLVSITSITRIVNKDRQMMGTLKSLGYSKGLIYLKYFLYSALASILGAIVGSTIGIFVLPYIIWAIYTSLYNLPSLVFTYQYAVIIIFSLIMVLLIVLAATIISFTCLKEHVSNLITGKAPLPGKKILLEKITFLWKRLPFSIKSMFRNVFRFKKNLVMIIIGIGGCTALLLTGFGISDSLGVLQNDQFNTVLKYDVMLKMSNPSYDINPVSDYENTLIYTYEANVEGYKEDIPITIIGGSSDLINYVDLPSDFNENSVIITSQISDLLDVKIGDSIDLTLDDYNQDLPFNLKVSGITTNYINNYVYLGSEAFKSYFPNLIENGYLVKLDMSDDEIKNLLDDILTNDEYSSLGLSATSTTSIKNMYSSVLDNLGYVVLIIVLVSGALVAIVTYNLTDIIINERVKEIATLRVNGYTLGQSLFYIYKEIIFMSVVAILIGLGAGVLLHLYVISSISSVGLTFGTSLAWQSYIYSILLSLAFVGITAIIFYPKVKKISMTEALKSVD